VILVHTRRARPRFEIARLGRHGNSACIDESLKPGDRGAPAISICALGAIFAERALGTRRPVHGVNGTVSAAR
jgi:hypothetical protein